MDNIDQLMKDTFVAHEHLAAPEEDVLAALQSRIDHHRSGLARPLAVAASAAVVVGAAGTAVVLSEHHGTHTAPEVQRPAATHYNVSHPTHQAAVRHNNRAPRAATLTMPYDLGWLPDGSAAYIARRINIGGVSDTGPPSFDGEYMLTVTNSNRAVDVDVQQFPGALDGAAFKSGPGTRTTINGRPGIESSNSAGPGGYELYYEDAAGGLMYVNIAAPPGATIPADQLVAIGRHVAETIHFPGTTEITPTFGIGYVPDGMQVRAFDVEDASELPGAGTAIAPMTSYDLGATDTQQSGVSIAETDVPARGTTPGRHVQGHETRYSDDHGYRTLVVENAVDGQDVMIASGRVPLSELYNIGDGLVLPN